MSNVNVQDVLSILQGTLNSNGTKSLDLPTPLILTGFQAREGLSAREITKEIITRKADLGIPIGNLPDGSESIDEKMIFIIVDTIIKKLLQDAKITVVIPLGVPVTASGAGTTGPVTVQGITTTNATGYGIIQ